MPVIFPKNLKGVTSGILREIKAQGYSTAGGGLWSKEFVINSVKNIPADFGSYKAKNEPLGEYMNAMEQTAKEIESVTDAISRNTAMMVERAKEATRQVNDVSGKMRDGAEKLGAAMEKFAKISGNANFAETAKTAESLVNSLERLAELEKSGVLDRVMKAMAK